VIEAELAFAHYHTCLPARKDALNFTKGIQLGKQLEEIDHAERWKILADLWTEMILYNAPSDNAKDHIQNLANGGEFLTHLWALLSHAGILSREEHGGFYEVV
jgi:hypothetical protein